MATVRVLQPLVLHLPKNFSSHRSLWSRCPRLVTCHLPPPSCQQPGQVPSFSQLLPPPQSPCSSRGERLLLWLLHIPSRMPQAITIGTRGEGGALSQTAGLGTRPDFHTKSHGQEQSDKCWAPWGGRSWHQESAGGKREGETKRKGGTSELCQGGSLSPTGTAECDVPPSIPQSERRQGTGGTGGTQAPRGVEENGASTSPPSLAPQLPPKHRRDPGQHPPRLTRQQHCRALAAPPAPPWALLLPSPRSSSALAGDTDTVPPRPQKAAAPRTGCWAPCHWEQPTPSPGDAIYTQGRGGSSCLALSPQPHAGPWPWGAATTPPALPEPR